MVRTHRSIAIARRPLGAPLKSIIPIRIPRTTYKIAPATVAANPIASAFRNDFLDKGFLSHAVRNITNTMPACTNRRQDQETK
jgi:hypothetical protein